MTDLPPYGEFAFDPEARTLKGLLLPFGETSRPSQSGHTSTFSADDITLPRDPSVVTLNREHNRFDPVGRARLLEKREEGVYAEFELADTDEADDWLSRQKDNLRKLSAEVFFAADRVKAKLTGAGLVTEGAFASAGLFALAELPAEEDGTGAIEVVVRDAPAPNTPSDAPSEVKPEEETERLMSSIVPDGAAITEAPATDLNALYSAITTGAGREAFKNAGALFAIANVQDSGPSGATIGADTRVPQAVQELWTRRPYSRKFVSLINSGTLTSTRVYGWRWVTEPTVSDYAGNLAEVPSTAVDTEPVTADALRLAGGNKIDRRFRDFNDTAVIASFLSLQTEAYARQSDAKALAAILAGATETDVTALAAPAAGTAGLVGIVDGALSVIDTENTPSFAIVDPSLYRDILLTPKDQVFEFLSAGFGLEEGTAAGFRIVPGNVGAGNVLVGAKEAATFYELGGGAPIRVSGLDVLHGGEDVAVFGYCASIINNSDALALVDTASYDTAV
jgi:hypothetical protein